MPRKFAIDLRLSDEQRAEFAAFIHRPNVSVADAHRWLADRGLKVSWHGIANWVGKEFASKPLVFRSRGTFTTDADELRMQIARNVRRLLADEVRMTAAFTSFLLGLHASRPAILRRHRKPWGVSQMKESKGDQTAK